MSRRGAIRHFFLVGGCDGAKPGRNYFTELVKQAPTDTVILTLACGKYRFNDLDIGTIGGLPRIMDMGQCNDAYSAIRVAVALSDAFGCGVNDLPLSMILSWYEQKAVCILLMEFPLSMSPICTTAPKHSRSTAIVSETPVSSPILSPPQEKAVMYPGMYGNSLISSGKM